MQIESQPPVDYVPEGPFTLARFDSESNEGTLIHQEFETLVAARARAEYLECTTEFDYEVIDNNLYTIPRLQ